MKYFRNACSTLSTRSAWPWRDGVHIIYVTAHFTHTNATQPLLMLWQFVPLQHSHKGLRIHCGCWSRKKKKRSPVPKLTFTVVCTFRYTNTVFHTVCFQLLAVQTCQCHHSGQSAITSWIISINDQTSWATFLSRFFSTGGQRKKILQKEEEKTFTKEQVRTDILSFCPSTPSLSIIPYFTVNSI